MKIIKFTSHPIRPQVSLKSVSGYTDYHNIKDLILNMVALLASWNERATQKNVMAFKDENSLHEYEVFYAYGY